VVDFGTRDFMSEISVQQVSNFGFLLDGCPEPCGIIEGETIVATNRAFRTQFEDAGTWRACIDAADHEHFPRELDASQKFTARPALGAHAGKRMQWTAWPLNKDLVFVRLDGPAGPEIPAALESMFTEPLTLAGMIVGKMVEKLEATIWSIAKDGNHLVSEGAGLAHFGIKPGQLVGLNAFQIYPEGASVRVDLEKTLERGEIVRGEQVDMHGHWMRECHPVRNAAGEITAMVGFALGAAESARELGQARALFRAIAELPVTVWAMDADGTCTLSVGKGLRHFGLETGALVGKNLLQVYPKTSSTHGHILQALQGETITSETRIGDMTWFSTILPVRDSLGQKITEVYGVAENVTERSQAQRRIEEQLALIQSQQEAIAALTSPIIEVWQGVLVVPLIGSLDGHRAGRLLEHLLAEVVNRQSRAVILDLTGAQIVDSSMAQHLFDIMRSIRLLGSEGLVSGIRPNVAKAMVELDIAGTEWKTFPTLAEALRRIIGKRSTAR
jgi:rsbT co-antagonist protein RsbR